MIRQRTSDHDGTRGQGLVEFALILPIILAIVVSVGELGLMYGKVSSLGYGSREGARTASALALGDSSLCSPIDRDPSLVDAVALSAVQRILKSPDAGIDLNQIVEVRIFKATPSGAEEGGLVNIWHYGGPASGPDVDEGPGRAKIDFVPVSVNWPACDRNNGANPDSLGVTVRYRYQFVTPLPAIADAISGGAFPVTLSETTVMALNPTVG
jgi:hypothetical protein